MPTYVMIANYTEKGVRDIADAPARAEAYRQLVRSKGGTAKDIYWTLGQTDLVVISEMPDDATAAAVALSVSKLGNVRGYTMRAFNEKEMGQVLSKM